MDNNEITFWKVIHNKYLFNKIFYFIETVEWIKYEDFQRCNDLKNKKKFKDITSLKWMLVNKQYQLLKYKIINGEYIKINEKGMQYIINLSSRNTISDIHDDENIQDQYRIKKPNYNKDINEENQYYDTILTEEEIIEQDILLKEILVLLLEHKRLELSSIDLIGLLLHKENPNQEILELLLNEPYSVPVTAMNLDLAISVSTLTILKILVKSIPLHDQIYPDLLLENSICRSIASKQSGREEMVEFILNHEPKLIIPLQYNFNGPVKKQAFKIIDGSVVTNSEYIVGDENDHVRVDLHKVLYFKDSTIKQLIKNGYLIFSLFNFKLVYGVTSNQELLLTNVNNLLGTIQNDGDGTDGATTSTATVQEIYKLISKESNSFYFQYLYKYEPIVGLNDIIYFSFIMYTFNLNKLQPLKLDIDGIGGTTKYKNQLLISDDKFIITNLTVEFTVFYITNYNYFSSDQVDQKIIDFLFSKSSTTNPVSNQDYEYIISILIPTTKSVSSRTPSSLLLNLPKVRNESIKMAIQSENKKLKFQNFETVDWFFENYEFLKTFVNFSSLDFSKFKFLEYAVTKYKSKMNGVLSGVARDFILSNCFSNAIDTCDFEDMKYLDKLLSSHLNNEINYLGGNSQYSMFSPKSIDFTNYIQLFEYLNSINYKIFTNHDSFCNFLIRFLNNYRRQQESIGLTAVDLSKIQINFNKFGGGKNGIINLFIGSLIGSSKMEPCSTIIELMILSGCNPIGYGDSFSCEWASRSMDETDNSFINEDGNNIKFHYHSCLYYIPEDQDEDKLLAYYCNSNESIDQFIQCIELIVLEYNNTNTHDEMYQLIINHLFKRLIRIKNVPIDRVCYIVDYLQSNSKPFQFEHTLFHSFYYIGIKSLKLMKFILRLPLVLDIFQFGENPDIEQDIHFTEYDGQQTNPELQVIDPLYNGYDIKNYLNPLIFNFNYIFKSDIGNEGILESLITNLVYSSITQSTITNNSSTYNSLNYVLEYLLEFRKFNLFFKHLQIINEICKSYGMVFKYSNSLVKNALIVLHDENQFKEFIQLNSGESIKESLLNNNFKFKLLLNHYGAITELMVTQFNYKEYWYEMYCAKSSKFTIHHIFKYYNLHKNLIPFDKILIKPSKFGNDQILLNHLKNIIKKDNLTG